MFPENTTLVYNTQTQALGLAVCIEASPYPAEEAKGIERVKVWAEVPGAGNEKFYGWDWWLMKDVVSAIALSEETLLIERIA